MSNRQFTFTRLRYHSGDWDTDQRMPSNILNSLIEYTTIPVNLQEKVIDLSSDELFQHPFCYISGHKLVQFDKQEAVKKAMSNLMHIPFEFETGGTRVIHYTPETYVPLD